MADFPLVPIAPGVPALPRSPLALVPALELMTRDLFLFFGGLDAPQWGLFLDGQPVVVCDNVAAFGFKENWRLSTYPLEEGAFETYNKVQTPQQIRFRFTTGGSLEARLAFLESIAAIIGGLDLFDAVTPEASYVSVNPVGYDYNRSHGATGLLSVDLMCEQVRVTTASQFTSATGETPSGTGGPGTGTVTVQPVYHPASPSGASPVNGGTVQTSPAPSNVEQWLSGGN